MIMLTEFYQLNKMEVESDLTSWSGHHQTDI
jgi:hypothetical protein